ncbi:LysR family transcriptional regulator [Pigmentiphaga soli]|uniref:LysR family transcriptional regulator n=1 Tax=Pigmentiphaga soli TaxID=1007095 RepID=A0ABP8GHT7_9BURK
MALPDPQTLRAFVAVAREGSVSRAAQRLSLSQPAVSLQLKGLAEATGLALFARGARGLALTADGAALLAQAERALAALGDFNRAVASLHDTIRGLLRIGTILDPEFIRLGAFLKRLVESAPQVQTELRQGMSGDVLGQVGRGELDVGFYLDHPDAVADPAGGPHGSRLGRFHFTPLGRFTYRVVAPAGWGPQVRGKDWKELAALPWLSTPADSVHHRLLAPVFRQAGGEPRRVALVDHEASMLDLVRSGVGLSLLRDSIAIRESQASGLVIADRVGLDCTLCFACLAARAGEPVVAYARQALAEVWR